MNQTSRKTVHFIIVKVANNPSGRENGHKYVYANNIPSKYMMQELIGLIGERDKSKITLGDVNICSQQMRERDNTIC